MIAPNSPKKEKKPFVLPNLQELVALIKEMDDEIRHVSLNLIKCDFEATEKDVIKAFPELKLKKVKNYKPGSFEVVFDEKIDAISFIRSYSDRKILNRRFFIKLGRQHKDRKEDWIQVDDRKGKHCFRPLAEKNPKKRAPQATERFGTKNRRLFEGMKADESETTTVEKQIEDMVLNSSDSEEDFPKLHSWKQAEARHQDPEPVADREEEDEDGWITVPIKNKRRY